MRRTSSASRTSTGAWGRDGGARAFFSRGLVSLRDQEEPRRPDLEGAPGLPVPVRAGRRHDGSWRFSPLLLLLVVLVVALLAVVGLLVWRSLGDNLSGTSVARDSIDSGPNPHIRLTNAAGQVRVEGVQDLRSIQYEVTRYALASDPVAAKKRASQVPIDLSREDSTVVLKTDGGRGTGADYLLKVPSGGSVEVDSGAGDVEVTGLSGEVTVVADAGDVTVRNTGSDVTVEAPQGDVTVGDVNTDTGQAELKVGTGDVSLQDVVVGTLEARVESGDVTLSDRFSGSGRVLVGTGNITANIPPEDTRELTLETRVGQVVRETPSGGEEPSKKGGGA
jgi:HAMP domain-containing protein